MLRKAARIPVILAVIGAFLNSGDLLAEFQPAGRGWIGYIAAASVGIGLYLCVEALLDQPHWPVIAGVVFFGLAEISGQVLHAALVRSDVAVMTDTLRWLMGYVSPSLVVISGVIMAFVVRYGFPGSEDADAHLVTREDLARLERSLHASVSQQMPLVPLTDLLKTAERVDKPEDYVVDVNNRLLRKNGGSIAVARPGAAAENGSK